MPKASRTPSAAQQQRRHNPLSEEYAPSELKQKSNKKRKADDVPNKEEGFVNSKASRNILQLGQDLAAEDEAEQEANRPAQPNPAFAFERTVEPRWANTTTKRHGDQKTKSSKR
jgi:essential nuclear protein 1